MRQLCWSLILQGTSPVSWISFSQVSGINFLNYVTELTKFISVFIACFFTEYSGDFRENNVIEQKYSLFLRFLFALLFKRIKLHHGSKLTKSILKATNLLLCHSYELRIDLTLRTFSNVIISHKGRRETSRSNRL